MQPKFTIILVSLLGALAAAAPEPHRDNHPRVSTRTVTRTVVKDHWHWHKTRTVTTTKWNWAFKTRTKTVTEKKTRTVTRTRPGITVTVPGEEVTSISTSVSTVIEPTTIVESTTITEPTTIVKSTTIIEPTTIVESTTITEPTTIVQSTTTTVEVTATPTCSTPDELLNNPSFESNNSPAWLYITPKRSASNALSQVDAGSQAKDGSVVLYSIADQLVLTGDAHRAIQSVRVCPGQAYKFSVWIKVLDGGRSRRVSVYINNRELLDVVPTTEWQRFEGLWTAGASEDSAMVQLIMTAGSGSGGTRLLVDQTSFVEA